MAKKSKDARAVSYGGSSGRLSTDITDAENGFIISVSGETGGKNPSYFSKRYISADKPGALKIASACLAGDSKGEKKSGGKKKIALKKG